MWWESTNLHYSWEADIEQPISFNSSILSSPLFTIFILPLLVFLFPFPSQTISQPQKPQPSPSLDGEGCGFLSLGFYLYWYCLSIPILTYSTAVHLFLSIFFHDVIKPTKWSYLAYKSQNQGEIIEGWLSVIVIDLVYERSTDVGFSPNICHGIKEVVVLAYWCFKMSLFVTKKNYCYSKTRTLEKHYGT